MSGREAGGEMGDSGGLVERIGLNDRVWITEWNPPRPLRGPVTVEAATGCLLDSRPLSDISPVENAFLN